ncbi:hypothetical protein Hte_010310 [Hypoxylon texense]
MAPPPATPTPHRFLVPKRSQPRQETPKAFQGGGQQFQATPRFSLHSTPRASGSGGGAPSSSFAAARTPASVGAAGSGLGAGAFFRPTPRNTDPINDVVSSSPPSSEQGIDDSGNKQHDPIDIEADIDADLDLTVDVDAVPESSPVRRSNSDRDVGSSQDEEDGLRSRSPKRRRISISSDFGPDIESLSQQPQREHEEDAHHDQDIDMIQSSLPLPLPPSLINNAPSPSSDDTDMGAEAVIASPTLTPKAPTAAHHQQQQQQKQPAFQKPPRFKAPVDGPEGSNRYGDPLPDAFSPHRRKGAKYIPGGLAASVRDWFVDVWAGATTGAGIATRRDGGGGNGDEWVARIRVDEVKAAPGMALITGRHVREDDDSSDDNRNDKDAGLRGVKVVLAGSPRVVGLAKREDVRQGSVVGIGRPTWEISIQDQGRWAVVCEWAILR